MRTIRLVLREGVWGSGFRVQGTRAEGESPAVSNESSLGSKHEKTSNLVRPVSCPLQARLRIIQRLCRGVG